jgi:hypothetical protein
MHCAWMYDVDTARSELANRMKNTTNVTKGKNFLLQDMMCEQK